MAADTTGSNQRRKKAGWCQISKALAVVASVDRAAVSTAQLLIPLVRLHLPDTDLR